MEELLKSMVHDVLFTKKISPFSFTSELLFSEKAEVPVLEVFVAGDVLVVVGLDLAGGVLESGEARLAHDALEHHAAGDDRGGLRLLEVFFAGRAEFAVKG